MLRIDSVRIRAVALNALAMALSAYVGAAWALAEGARIDAAETGAPNSSATPLRGPIELARLSVQLPGDAPEPFRRLWWDRLKLAVGPNDAPEVLEALAHWTPTHDIKTAGALLIYRASDSEEGSGRWVVHCSGTLVGRYAFLTAAHCIANPDDVKAHRVFLQHEGFLSVKSISKHPAYENPQDGSKHDLAIVKLRQSRWSIAPTQYTQPNRELNEEITVVAGFGAKRLDYFGLKKRGEGLASDNPGDEREIKFNPVGNPEPPIPCPRDSGGPMTDRRAQELLGVTGSTNVANVNCLNETNFVRLAHKPFLTWIGQLSGGKKPRKTLAEDAFSGCLIDPSVGDTCMGDGSSTFNFHQFYVPAGTRELLVTFNHGDDQWDGKQAAHTRFDIGVTGPAPEHACACTVPPAQFAECMCQDPSTGSWTISVERKEGHGLYQVTALALEPQSLYQIVRNWLQDFL